MGRAQVCRDSGFGVGRASRVSVPGSWRAVAGPSARGLCHGTPPCHPARAVTGCGPLPTPSRSGLSSCAWSRALDGVQGHGGGAVTLAGPAAGHGALVVACWNEEVLQAERPWGWAVRKGVLAALGAGGAVDSPGAGIGGSPSRPRRDVGEEGWQARGPWPRGGGAAAGPGGAGAVGLTEGEGRGLGSAAGGDRDGDRTGTPHRGRHHPWRGSWLPTPAPRCLLVRLLQPQEGMGPPCWPERPSPGVDSTRYTHPPPQLPAGRLRRAPGLPEPSSRCARFAAPVGRRCSGTGLAAPAPCLPHRQWLHSHEFLESASGLSRVHFLEGALTWAETHPKLFRRKTGRGSPG